MPDPIILPPACADCAPYDGAWKPSSSGLRRCDCERGRKLQESDAQRRNRVVQKAHKAAEKAAKKKADKRDRARRSRGNRRAVGDQFSGLPLREGWAF